MALPASIDRATFLAYLRQSGLLTESQFVVMQKSLPDSNRGRALARHLVEQGLLTKFQAERLLVGRTQGFLLGQYRILDQLGRGGMGRVFKAEHRNLNRIVALKVLAPNVLQTERARELFAREVRAVGQLIHPNIVTAYDANEEQGRDLVLEYVDGPNLEQLVRSQGPLPWNQACDYLRQAAHGLQCAHKQGMVHRDIKPANLLVQRKDNAHDLVKVGDFGLARLQTPGVETSGDGFAGTILTRDNTVMGTPDYLSPEQARNMHKLDIRSDLYSLGCTFYYLLTAQVLFPGGNSMDKLIRHGSEKPVPVTNLRPDLTPDVAAIVAKLLEKRPENRYQTPADLAAALEPYAVSGSIPWAPLPSAATPYLDGLATPVDPSDSEAKSIIDDMGSHEMSALANTVSKDTSPTPANTSRPASSARRRLPAAGFSLGRLVIALLLLILLLGGAALGVAMLMVFLFGR